MTHLPRSVMQDPEGKLGFLTSRERHRMGLYQECVAPRSTHSYVGTCDGELYVTTWQGRGGALTFG